jgi:dihydropteroate synthase
MLKHKTKTKNQISFDIIGKKRENDNPIIMGILNVTPDSYFKESRVEADEKLIAKATQMLADGAEILDIGGQSTRPGAELVDSETEWQRVRPVLELLRNNFPDTCLSIDTFYVGVAQKALDMGVRIVNDISAGEWEPQMLDVVATNNATYIAMHKKGMPKDMQDKPRYYNVVEEVLTYFEKKLDVFEQKGLKKVIIDPGFGFGKTLDHNYQLLNSIDYFKEKLGHPILVGISNKSMVYKLLHKTPEQCLEATSALHLFALQQGADILRVHQVKEAKEMVLLNKFLNETKVSYNE